MRQILAEPRSLAMGSQASSVTVTAHRDYAGEATSTATFQVKTGNIDVQADDDGTLELIALDATIGDIILSADAAPPNGMHFTNVNVRLSANVITATSWSNDGMTASATASVTLLVDWAILTSDGTVIPLAPVKVANVPVDVSVTHDAERHVALTFKAQRDGTFFNWANEFSLSDLKAQLTAGM